MSKHDVAPFRNRRNVLVISLAAKECPGCDKPKRVAHSFCLKCFLKLPRPMRNALYNRIGCGYEEAHADAMQHLGKVPIFETRGGAA
jgi:hypothetical protein